MPRISDYQTLYGYLNDGEIAYLFGSDPKLPISWLRRDDPPPYSDPPLLQRHQVMSLNRSYHGLGAWCAKNRWHKRKH